MDNGTCKGCGERIKWTETDTGNKMPLNARAEIRYVEREDGSCRQVKFYIPHWETCAKADEFHGADKTPDDPGGAA